MHNRCFVSQKVTKSGNNVSHSNRKTKRRFKVNKKFVYFEILDEKIKLCLSNYGIRSIRRKHGLENYLLSTPCTKLGKEAIKLKRGIAKRNKKLAAIIPLSNEQL